MLITHILSLTLRDSKLTLVSTEPDVVRWALTEIQQNSSGLVFSYGVYGIYNITGATAELRMRLLAGLVHQRWLVFAVERDDYHLKKRFEI